MEKQIIFHEVKSGDVISDVIRAMILKAQQSKKGVVCQYNEITLAVNPNSKLQEILNFYYSELAHFSDGYEEKIQAEERKNKITERRYRGC